MHAPLHPSVHPCMHPCIHACFMEEVAPEVAKTFPESGGIVEIQDWAVGAPRTHFDQNGYRWGYRCCRLSDGIQKMKNHPCHRCLAWGVPLKAKIGQPGPRAEKTVPGRPRLDAPSLCLTKARISSQCLYKTPPTKVITLGLCARRYR